MAPRSDDQHAPLRHEIRIGDPFSMYREVRPTEPMFACDVCAAAVPLLSLQTHLTWHARTGR
ncbi:MAG: hypothetical protein ACTHMS_23580 [Jatrophihabitans sp.]|uniref:hypothetical protein n=1 Tax=Jatrophihabitans sp. TaxID=1932789 RepID=UPI003F813A1B